MKALGVKNKGEQATRKELTKNPSPGFLLVTRKPPWKKVLLKFS